MKDLTELSKKADEVETLTDENGRSYYMVGDRKIFEMNIESEQDKQVAHNIKMMRIGGFSSGFDLMR